MVSNMKKIAITIKDNSLIFKYRTNKPVETNLLNTNVISNDELLFSDEYIIENIKIVSMFINDLVNERHINQVVVSNNVMGLLVIKLLKKITSIETFVINDDENITFALCDEIIKLKTIKKVNCYSIPQFLIENLDNHNITVESRYEVLFTSDFMASNNLTSFSKIYYKTNIRIGEVLNEDDINDIRSFFAVNKYLKVVHFEKYSVDNVKVIIKLIKEFKLKNILIQIHDDLDENQDVSELKRINKELQKKYKTKISLVYSKDYLERNYLQQVIFTTLKLCAVIIFTMVVAVLGYIGVNNYKAQVKVNYIIKELEDIMNEDEENTPKDTEGVDVDSNMINSYNKIHEINKDMVGWIYVPGTNVNYPVVKTRDNSYYLTHNIYKEFDYNGWVFMDYRNKADFSDDNTILYAHNRYDNGLMFGTLSNLRKSNWQNNKNNWNITFNNLYKEGAWKVFSIYGIDVTSDYLMTNFNDPADKSAFINMIKGRSEYNFNVNVDENDKILTLSTCLDTDRRFVVHAVLVK